MGSNYMVSAVIPHYGDSQPTLELIHSLQNQDYSGNLEIIVSDDNSPQPFPQVDGVKVVHRSENGGFGQNVNTGAHEATGEWLMILNSDLAISPSFIRNMMDVVATHGTAVYSPQVVNHSGKPQYVARKFPQNFYHAMSWFTPLARFRSTKLWHRLVGHDVRSATSRIFETDWVMGACMALPLASFRKVGGFDARFFMNSEEIDLQRRLKEIGCHAIFAGNVVVEHVGGGSSDDTKRRYWLTSSWLIYADKWGSRKRLSLALKVASLANLAFNTARRIRSKEVHPLEIYRQEMNFISGK